MLKQYYVYILASISQTLYIGVTNDLERRVFDHKRGLGGVFTHKYNITKLVYYEIYNDVYQAIAREKQLKSYRRQKKIQLIEQDNADWIDMSIDWYV